MTALDKAFIAIAFCFVLHFTPVENQGTKKRYFIQSTKEVTWYDAYFACLQNNSILANIESAEEFRDLTAFIDSSGVSTEHFWIGGNDIASEGNWVWARGQKVTFTNWNPTEPNNQGNNEDCMAIHSKAERYEWNDYICHGHVYYICESKIAINADWPPRGAGEKKFYVDLMKTDWHSAYMYCLRNNSRLARIENKEENDVVVAMIKEANLGFDLEYWLGATDFPEVGLYFWLSTGAPVRGYSNWHAGQGMAEDQRCLTYWQSSKHVVRWNDFICSTLYPFVCEYYE